MGILEDAEAAFIEELKRRQKELETFQRRTESSHYAWLIDTLGGSRYCECLQAPQKLGAPMTLWKIDQELQVLVLTENVNDDTVIYGNVWKSNQLPRSNNDLLRWANFETLEQLGEVLAKFKAAVTRVQ